MIWIRRIFVFPMSLLFFIALLASLLVFRLDGTLLNPDFYAAQFRKADIYNFLLNDLLASAIDEVREKEADELPGNFNENPLVTVDLSTQEIVDSVNRSVPPQWFQEQVERALDQVGGYFTGRRDDFQFTIRAKERVTVLVVEARGLLIKADAHDLLLDEVVEPKVEEALEEEGALPFDVPLSGSRIVNAVRVVVPEDWVEQQLVMAIDEVTPYVVGDRDSFEIRVELASLVDGALRETKDLLREADAYDLLYDEIIAPKVLEIIDQKVELSYGIEVSDEEVLSAMREVAPPEWVQEQAEGIINEAGAYLVGTDDSLEISVSLVDNKRDAVEVVQRRVHEELMAVLDDLPRCAEGQFLNEAFTISAGELPHCIPPELNLQQTIEFFDIGLSDAAAQAVDTMIPDNLTFTDVDLRQTLIDAGSERNVELLDQVRKVLSEGWVYTDQELRQDLLDNIGDDAVRVLDDVRDALRDGWIYTDADFRHDLTESERTHALDDIDDVRNGLGRVRTFQWVPYILAFLILVGIGFLGGRRWHSRVAWSAGVLFISSLIIFIAFGPVYSAVGSSRIDDARAEAMEDLSDTGFLAADKALTMADTAADDIVSGLRLSGLIISAIALVIFLLALAWPTERGLRVRRRLKLARSRPPVAEEGESTPEPSTSAKAEQGLKP